MTAERGAIVRRGDTGGYAVVISNDMLHTVSSTVILTTVVRSESMAEAWPNVIGVDAAGEHLFAIPVSVHTAPASAIKDVVGRATNEQLRSIVRVLHAATSS
ncbi:hypothetical protein [Glycomyces artemisiae]|uniref:mRNA interferase MazF n=1 Tax=Glycomyces artemisiae TaxID=1076443 RepID=A0A2T0U6I3_9ACTN|nr:hypothetical protein [Glycomyces artemisiae]PRY53535.1 hypothetical protein B0I28_11734 [Glycomyces artemisiae]